MTSMNAEAVEFEIDRLQKEIVKFAEVQSRLIDERDQAWTKVNALAKAVLDAKYYTHHGMDTEYEMQPVEGWPEIRKLAKELQKNEGSNEYHTKVNELVKAAHTYCAVAGFENASERNALITALFNYGELE